MRITQSMLANNTLKQITRSYANLDKYQTQLSTGKKSPARRTILLWR